jgi:hypothetical protein
MPCRRHNSVTFGPTSASFNTCLLWTGFNLLEASGCAFSRGDLGVPIKRQQCLRDQEKANHGGAIERIRGSSPLTMRGLKPLLTNLHKRLWSGGSVSIIQGTSIQAELRPAALRCLLAEQAVEHRRPLTNIAKRTKFKTSEQLFTASELPKQITSNQT